MPFDDEYVDEIEAALEKSLPGGWRRLTEEELDNQTIYRHAGWSIDLPNGSILIDGVDHLQVIVDSNYPYSQPRVRITQIADVSSWPHVEKGELLCLRKSRINCGPGSRIIDHISWAVELLRFDEAKCEDEFDREFASYWSYFSTNNPTPLRIFSLLGAAGESRYVFYIKDIKNNLIVVSDTDEHLHTWYENFIGVAPISIQRTWIYVVDETWKPADFPQKGRDIFRRVPGEVLAELLVAGEISTIFIEKMTKTGPVFGAVITPDPSFNHLKNQFSKKEDIPTNIVKAAFYLQDVLRYSVRRADSKWIHGRDHNEYLESLSSKSIAVIGCGSLGSAIVRLLVQAGVGSLLLVDPDNLSSANISRHMLGLASEGQNKAREIEKSIKREFPHISFIKSFANRFEDLSDTDIEKISEVDLIVSAGIDFEGDICIDRWRRSLPSPPPHVCSWIEAYAVCGHAIVLFNDHSLQGGFDEDEMPIFRLTDWPPDSNFLRVEAGCGNLFQPHGILDMQPSITMTSQLVVDVLLRQVETSSRRVWMSDASIVERNGGVARSEFSGSYTINEEPWDF